MIPWLVVHFEISYLNIYNISKIHQPPLFHRNTIILTVTTAITKRPLWIPKAYLMRPVSISRSAQLWIMYVIADIYIARAMPLNCDRWTANIIYWCKNKGDNESHITPTLRKTYNLFFSSIYTEDNTWPDRPPPVSNDTNPNNNIIQSIINKTAFSFFKIINSVFDSHLISTIRIDVKATCCT